MTDPQALFSLMVLTGSWGDMNKWLLLLVIAAGCSAVNRGRLPAPLIARSSFDQPLIATNPDFRIVDWENVEWFEPAPGAAEFNLYYSSISSNVYDQAIFGITNLYTAISNMVPGTTYYIGVTAVDTNGVESDLSDQCVFLMPETLEFGFAFDQSVTNVSVQSSNDLMTWQASNARPRTNGLWRVDVDPNTPLEFYRGIGQVAPAL